MGAGHRPRRRRRTPRPFTVTRRVLPPPAPPPRREKTGHIVAFGPLGPLRGKHSRAPRGNGPNAESRRDRRSHQQPCKVLSCVCSFGGLTPFFCLCRLAVPRGTCHTRRQVMRLSKLLFLCAAHDLQHGSLCEEAVRPLPAACRRRAAGSIAARIATCFVAAVPTDSRNSPQCQPLALQLTVPNRPLVVKFVSSCITQRTAELYNE